MISSALGLTTPEWDALLDISGGLTPFVMIAPDVLERLTAMGLVTTRDAGRPALTWTGREFVELRTSGLFGLVGHRPSIPLCP